jgi:hypothetical protein
MDRQKMNRHDRIALKVFLTLLPLNESRYLDAFANAQLTGNTTKEYDRNALVETAYSLAEDFLQHDGLDGEVIPDSNETEE